MQLGSESSCALPAVVQGWLMAGASRLCHAHPLGVRALPRLFLMRRCGGIRAAPGCKRCSMAIGAPGATWLRC